MSVQPDARDPRTRFLALQARLQRSEGADEQLLKEAAAALDEAVQSGVALAASEVEPLLLRPPWSDARPGLTRGYLSIDEARRVLCACRPRASALLDFLDARQEVHEPHRRLGEQRHRPWAAASVRACVAAVRQAALHTGGRAPLVLVAEGSLGAEAAAAAAAGGRVVVCEPNPNPNPNPDPDPDPDPDPSPSLSPLTLTRCASRTASRRRRCARWQLGTAWPWSCGP